MTNTTFVKTISAAATVLLFSCTSSKITTSPSAPLPIHPKVMTGNDSLSYAIGVQVATYYKGQGMDSANADRVMQAFEDVFNDSPLVISNDQANVTIQEKLQQYMTAKMDKEKEKSKEFLDSVAKLPGVIKLPSGLMYEVIKQGDGPIPKATDTVKANYIGSLMDGKEFDNSYKRGQPLQIPVGGVIRGWVEALQLMPVGSKWKLYIPSELGYGDRGAGGAIPGGAALVFTIELLEIVH